MRACSYGGRALACPVLLLGFVQPGEAQRVVEHGLTAIVHRVETAMALDEAASALGMGEKSTPVHIKVDTGLGRFGCLPDEFLSLAQAVLTCRIFGYRG